MAGPKHAARLASQYRSVAASRTVRAYLLPGVRSLSSTAPVKDEATVESTSSASGLDPALVCTPKEERALLKTGVKPIGSRRRRAALQSSSNLPFEQLPYQCFQEARKVLQVDREDKLQQITTERARIERLQAQDPATCGGEAQKQRRLASMQKYLEKLKILADINDPVIKKRFEDGKGDMDRPIYRYLADRQWRSYRRPLVVQRITQMDVVPDILPSINPTADVRIAFGRRKIPPGEFVESRVSETPPHLRVQVFDKGDRLVSVAVVDPDVPDPERNNFKYRCHFLACNIPISPTSTSVPLSRLSAETQTLLPWLPPHAQKGTRYHRLSVFVMQQPNGSEIDAPSLREKIERDGFKLRSFVDKLGLLPIGGNMFRSQWDEWTAGVMKRAGVEGTNVEFRREKLEPLRKVQLPLKKKENIGGLPSKRT
ncbi:MAG: hypothetical protein M1832_004287 [Thelocarpon impressellum]|nr:MAG: hypothetical protein M1832_004287 [Thelocarpon impressellum]